MFILDNYITQEEKEFRHMIIDEIKKFKFDIIDIGDQYQSDGSMDFIKETQMVKGSNIMKGFDLHKRPFFVFKAKFEFYDYTTFETFTTFYQSSPDDELKWHSCGDSGSGIMDTTGYATEEQLKFIFELFNNGYVYLDREKCFKLKLIFTKKMSFTNNKFPVIVSISGN